LYNNNNNLYGGGYVGYAAPLLHAGAGPVKTELGSAGMLSVGGRELGVGAGGVGDMMSFYGGGGLELAPRGSGGGYIVTPGQQ
jgi:hypothetical protein